MGKVLVGAYRSVDRTMHAQLAEVSTINLHADWHSFDEYCEVADLIKDTLERQL